MEGDAAGPAVARKAWWKAVVLVLAVGLLLVAARALHLDAKLGGLDDWIKSLGAFGPLAFILIYIAATVAMIPGTVLTAGAGVLFGSALGVVCVSVASTLGASFCFLIARYFARDTVAGWLSGRKGFQRLDRLTERQGWVIVAVTRLVPLFPFNLLNYGFGLTRVRFWTYALGSWAFMLPGTILYVVGGDAIKTAIKEGRMPWGLAGVVVSIVVVLAIVGRSAQRRLKQVESGEGTDTVGAGR
jgi:uncharacterized membrane protein YdjX (TVP38/TMEM64 family)